MLAAPDYAIHGGLRYGRAKTFYQTFKSNQSLIYI